MKEYPDYTIRAKIIEFNVRGDCVGIDEQGNKILIDPFVGCAFNYENREHLIGSKFEMTGFIKDGVLLVTEGKMKLLL